MDEAGWLSGVGGGTWAGAWAPEPTDRMWQPEPWGGALTGFLEPEEITVHLGGLDVAATATLDLDDDGLEETAFVTDPHGVRLAASDTDHDGIADHAALLDAGGHVLDTASWDPAQRLWVEDPATAGALFPEIGGVLAAPAAGTHGDDPGGLPQADLALPLPVAGLDPDPGVDGYAVLDDGPDVDSWVGDRLG